MSAKLLAVLLGYPDEALLEAVPELRAAAAQLERSRRRRVGGEHEEVADGPVGLPVAPEHALEIRPEPLALAQVGHEDLARGAQLDG